MIKDKVKKIALKWECFQMRARVTLYLSPFHFYLPFILYSLFFILFAPVFPQNQPKFIHYSIADGLSQNTVNSIFQDSRGFMWFGTQAGLNRFDGYEFKIFKHNPADSLSISNNWIWDIFEDSRGTLWIGTFGGGLNRFDHETETFRAFRHNPKDSANTLLDDTIWFVDEDDAGILWVSGNTGLNRFDPATGGIRHFRFTETDNNCFHHVKNAQNELFFTTPQFFYRFDMRTCEYTQYPIYADTPGKMSTLRSPIALDNDGAIWLGTGDGLLRLTFDKKAVSDRHLFTSENSNLLKNGIMSLFIDNQNVLYAGSESGLHTLNLNDPAFRQNPHAAEFTQITHSPFIQTSLKNNRIYAIGESRGGELWVGTELGLSRHDRSNRKFEHFAYNPGEKNTLANPLVLDIEEDSQQRLWIATHNGLSMFDPNTRQFSQFNSGGNKPAESLRNSYVFSLLEDARKPGGMWVGTIRGGLHWLDWKTGKFQQYPFAPGQKNGTLSANIYTIYADKSRQLWVGTSGGVSRYLRNENRFDRVADSLFSQPLSHKFVYSILQDHFDQFWFGTAGGLNHFDPVSGEITAYLNNPGEPQSLSNNFVLCLHESPKTGDIWIGTNGGLNRLVREPEVHFRSYRQKDGLPDDLIYGILEDDTGNLWLSAQNGLVKAEIFGDSLAFTLFTKSDGLQGDEFNMNAFLRGKNGKMYFGGSNGFNAFFPENVTENQFVPPVAITDFRVLNESVPIAGNGQKMHPKTYTIPKTINMLDALELSWRQNVFSFEFAALNFTNPQENEFAYMMEGFDENWIYSGNRRFVTYTNLDPGEYVFRVKASNNDGVWNETGKAIRIAITPPPWRTWWAGIIYAIIILGGIYGIIRFRIREAQRKIGEQSRIDRAKTEERERVRKKSAADFHDEAGHLITKITLFLELARRQASENKLLNEYLDKMEEHTKSLAGGMRDFIWGLDPEKDSLQETLIRLRDFGNKLFQHSDVRFIASPLVSDFGRVELDIDDRRAIMFIFKEAMHNCLKHASATNASLDAHLDGESLQIAFSDNGKGISQHPKTGGYGLKNMQSRAAKMGATLQISSEADRGTRIVFEKILTKIP